MKSISLRAALEQNYSAILALGEGKEGKSCYLVAQALGVHPYQSQPPKDKEAAKTWKRLGGVVTSPRHLHIIDMDTATLSGLPEYLLACGVTQAQLDVLLDEKTGIDVISMQADKLKVLNSTTRGDSCFYQALVAAHAKVTQKVRELPGVHVIIAMSWTNMCALVEKGLFGDLGAMETNQNGDVRMQTADMPLWSNLKQKLQQIQMHWQSGDWHMWWEGHVAVEQVVDPDTKKTVKRQTLMAHGAGANRWPITTGLNLRIARNPGYVIGNKLEEQYVDTDAAAMYGFLPRSRGHLTLRKKETDMTEMLTMLKYKVGGYIP